MFYKEKGFYISLACGIVALVTFAAICYSLMGGSGENGTDTPMVAQESEKPAPTEEPETEETSSQGLEPEEEELEEDTPEQKEQDTQENKTADKKNKTTPAPEQETEPETVETDANPVKSGLHFDQETGLLWPLEGNVLMEYSADQVVYFKTLAQYRTNPALLIEAEEGADVKASADGIVKDISTSEETGRTVTMDIGDNFTVSYGQLKGLTVQKGDSVTEGQVIGKVAAPTSYYSMEGTNLYYQVKENADPVNPMLLLR